MRKAFTLIELLVVIAIIAILAAILFPVFTQAKAAAKKTQSISNAKQNLLASIMYSNDADDLVHPAQTWGGGGPATVGGVSTSPWTWLVMPYMKSGDILMDAQAPGPLKWPATWPELVAKSFQPEYGFNVDGLAQVVSTSAGMVHNVKSFTSMANPADTVMYTAKNSRSEVQGLATATGFWWFGPGTYNIQLTVQQPYCDPAPTVVCGYDWGSSQFLADSILARKEAAGAYTGAASMRGTGSMIVAWTDGHVSAKNWGAMTQGTNFGKLANGTWINGANGILLQDKSKYVWDIE